MILTIQKLEVRANPVVLRIMQRTLYSLKQGLTSQFGRAARRLRRGTEKDNLN